MNSQQRASQRELAELGHNASMESILSAQFIVTDSYGTRSSTTLKVDAQGDIDWREQSYDPRGSLQGERQFALQRQRI